MDDAMKGDVPAVSLYDEDDKQFSKVTRKGVAVESQNTASQGLLGAQAAAVAVPWVPSAPASVSMAPLVLKP